MILASLMAWYGFIPGIYILWASVIFTYTMLAAFTLERLLVRHVRGTGGAFVLTDDRAPTEALADEDLLSSEEPR